MARRTAALAGWRRCLVAVGLGALASAALPPLFAVPLLGVAFTGLVWLIDGAGSARSPARAAFAAGWWFGFGHFIAGLYWITNSLLVDADRFGWLVPFAVSGLSAGLAIFPGLAAAAVRLGGARGAGRVLALAVAWTVVEWLRGQILSGFPWNLVGTAWVFSDAVSQTVALTGAYGLSLLTVALAAAPATLGDGVGGGAADADAGRGRRWAALAVMTALFGVLWAAGEVRLASAPAKVDPAAAAGSEGSVVPDVRLRLVQANIDQRLKWSPSERAANFRKFLSMTRGPGFEKVTHVIWPETAVPYIVARDAGARAAIAAVVPPKGLVITGAIRATPAGVKPVQLWNSAHAIDRSARIVGTYDKFHLVPFGEYMPLRDVLPLKKITRGAVDFSAGPGPRTLALPGLPPVSLLICYEVIFPGNVLDRRNRPRWILNLTNDAWFGDSTGPYQHFAAARLRAVEEGLALVRSANTGISAVIDPYGRVIARLGLGVEGVLDSPLPLPLVGLTPYARFGDWILLGMLTIAVGLAFIASLPARPAGRRARD
ncbi:MAG: apolipoprotein N-acyltransferase [Proteobacteria bacterium]|nr:apolipoprotein N-acyltransferase [Pseudomonadota bacterium]